MVGLGIRLEKTSNPGIFFLSLSLRISLSWWDLREIVVVDERHLMPPPPSLPTSSIAPNAFAVPSISPLSRFADLSLRPPPFNSLVYNSSDPCGLTRAYLSDTLISPPLSLPLLILNNPPVTE
jgi:hypothetical protein